MMRMGAAVVLLFISNASAHSWMSCPRSFKQLRGRGGDQSPPCEGWYLGAENNVNAGDRLKVGWTSNNHGGGYVRIALVRATTTSKSDSFGAKEEDFKQNVIKFACYGHDTRSGRTKFGDCIHPCNGRPGCEYQSDIADVERFDTTITVPTNLPDGVYILQTAMLVGNSGGAYYSCAKMNIKGGNPNLNCQSDTAGQQAPKYKCHRAGGPAINQISDGTKRGEFCYHSDRRGEVDDRISQVPVNLDCDPRIYCGYSVNSKVCYQEKGMTYLDGAVSARGAALPHQPNCDTTVKSATCTDGIKNQDEEGVDCGGSCPTKCPTCTDGIQNQNEDGVDCGGECPACATCFDGVKNQDETGVDCGGSTCKICPHCRDGVKNGDETGVDCGGKCPVCPTCADGIQNQGENGVDCGGPCCNTCLPTCKDKLQNQNETGVDCGGPCTPCGKIETVDYIQLEHLEKDYNSGPIHISVVMTFLEDVPRAWKLRIEYNQKIEMLSTCGAAKLVEQNEFGTIFTFKSNPWGNLPLKGEKRQVYLVVKKSTSKLLVPTGDFFELDAEKASDEMVFHADDEKDVGPECGPIRCSPGQYCFRRNVLPCRGYPCEVTEKCMS